MIEDAGVDTEPDAETRANSERVDMEPSLVLARQKGGWGKLGGDIPDCGDGPYWDI
jgi:hypothetical protein